MLGHRDRLGAGKVDQPVQSRILRLSRSGFAATPHGMSYQFWPIWPRIQWTRDSCGIPKRNPVAGDEPRFPHQLPDDTSDFPKGLVRTGATPQGAKDNLLPRNHICPRLESTSGVRRR